MPVVAAIVVALGLLAHLQVRLIVVKSLLTAASI